MVASVLLAGVLAASQVAAPSSTGQITGQVVDGDNRIVADARVTLTPTRFAGPPAGPPPQATTDQDGRYTFDVAPGTYRVQADKAGFAVRLPGPGAEPPPSVTVNAGQVTEAPQIVLFRGGAIAGRVLDPSGQPLADARVSALRSTTAGNRSMMLPVGQGAQTNDLGEFRVFGLPPGEYYVQASGRPDIGPMGVAPQARATLLAPTYFPGTVDQTGAKPVTVGAGETTGGLSIQMMVTAAFHIAGHVVDESGAPVANAVIVAMLDRTSGGPAPSTGPPGRIRTDASGAFLLPNLAAGAYTLTAAAPIVSGGGAPPVGSGAGSGIGASTGGGFFAGSGAGATAGGFSMTETRNGVTTQYRSAPGSGVRVEVTGNVDGVQLVARRPQ